MITELFSLAQIGYSQGGGHAGGGFSMTYILIIGVSMLASFLISGTLKRRFTEYSQIPIRMTGAEIAEKMLRDKPADPKAYILESLLEEENQSKNVSKKYQLFPIIYI